MIPFETSAKPPARGIAAAIVIAALAATRLAAADVPSSPLLSGAGARDAGAPSMTTVELGQRLAPLGDADPTARRNAAAAASALGPEARGAIETELAALKQVPDDTFVAALKAARAARGPRGAPRRDDLVETLLAAGEGAPEDVRPALTAVCLLRALARQKTTPALRAIVSASSDHAFALRPEATRLLHDAGAAAVPALIDARNGGASTREWAQAVLESIGKRTPADAVQTETSQELAEVLDAYGAAHDMDALTVVLAFVNSDRAEVRDAARRAIGAYGDGALGKTREAYANLTGKPAPSDWDAPRAARELFSAYDRVRLQDVFALFDEGLVRAGEGKIDDAAADFDRVLARQPMFERRAEMAPTYVQIARAREDGDRDAAIDALHKAARLDPTGPAGQAAASELAYLEGDAIAARGVADPEPFRRALALDAGNQRARAALDRIDAAADARRHRSVLGLGACALGLLLLSLVFLFGRLPAAFRAKG